jgi:hypothetical protein
VAGPENLVLKEFPSKFRLLKKLPEPRGRNPEKSTSQDRSPARKKTDGRYRGEITGETAGLESEWTGLVSGDMLETQGLESEGTVCRQAVIPRGLERDGRAWCQAVMSRRLESDWCRRLSSQ